MVDLRQKLRVILITVLLVVTGGMAPAADADEDGQDSASSAIITKFVQATQNHQDSLRGASMEVEISAFVPRLKQNGHLKALRKISKVGQVTYRVLMFQGDNTIKNQVIARYLQAEQQEQGGQGLAIIPANYKFKYRGEKQTADNKNVYVFALTPRKNRVGLFKGEIWLDTRTCLPILEKGRLAKNPSAFFKKVDFERAFAIQNGLSIPAYMNSTIDTRLIGKVELNINYSKFNESAVDDDEHVEPSESTVALHAVP